MHTLTIIRMVLLLLFLSPFGSMQAQSFFHLIEDFNPTGQSQIYSVEADSQYIYVIGDYIDSARTNIWMFYAVYDYTGRQVIYDTLPGVNVRNLYNSRTIKMFKKSKGCYYCFYFYSDSNYVGYNYLVELDFLNQKIKRAAKLLHMKYGTVTYMTYDQKNKITLISYLNHRTLPKEKRGSMNIIEMDTLLQTTRVLSFFKKGVYPFHISINPDSSYTIIGDEHLVRDSARKKYTTFIVYMKIGPDGTILKYFRHPFPETRGHVAFGIDAASYTVVRDERGRFYIGFVHEKRNMQTTDAMGWQQNDFPYVMSYSREFDTLFWHTPMLRPHTYTAPGIEQASMCGSSDGSGYVTAGDMAFVNEVDTFQYGEAFAFKVSPQGDSLWFHTYATPQYEAPDSILFSQIRFVRPTPYGYVLAGTQSDRAAHKYHSVIIHVDFDGCLVPGCLVSTRDVAGLGKEQQLFRAGPNPFTDQLYLSCLETRVDRCPVKLYDLSGHLVYHTQIRPVRDRQYILSLAAYLEPGTYFLSIESAAGEVIFTQMMVKR